MYPHKAEGMVEERSLANRQFMAGLEGESLAAGGRSGRENFGEIKNVRRGLWGLLGQQEAQIQGGMEAECV